MLNHGIRNYKYKKCTLILLTLFIYGIHFEKNELDLYINNIKIGVERDPLDW